MTNAVVYTAPQCPHSKRLKQFLVDKGISFEEKCVLTDPAVFSELVRVSNQQAVPVAVIDGEIYVGFDKRVERRMLRKMGG